MSSLSPLHSGPLFPCHNHSRARYRQLGTDPTPQSPLKLFKLASPKPAYPTSQFVPVGTPAKALAHIFPSLPSAFWPTCVPLHGKTCSLLGTLRNKLSFQWQSYSNLLVSAYLNNHKIYILKYKGGFPGGAVVENLPANAGHTGSSPGLGSSHMPRSN